MRLDDFKVEQWMNENEGQAKYNLTDTCASSFSLQELLNMGEIDASHILMDYGEIVGDTTFRNEILGLYKRGTIDQITTTNGCLEANILVMETILEPKDHVIACVPGYQQFTSYPESIGCFVTAIELREEKDWIPSLVEFKEAILPDTKLIILNNPNNPTGTLLKEGFLDSLIKLCQEKGIYILCDEVYRDPDQCASISDLYEKGISTSSLSKMYGLAGLRLGWVKGPENLIRKINARRDYIMISTGALRDALGTIALQNKADILARTHAILRENKAYLEKWLSKNTRFSCVIPEAGTVGFLKIEGMHDSCGFSKEILKEEGVFFVPGACFDHEGYMRLGLGQDPSNFKEGLKRLAAFLEK